MSVLPLSLAPKLYGQKKAEQQFYHSVRNHRLSHAWIIEGNRGVGKSAMAVRMARFLLEGASQQAIFKHQATTNMDFSSSDPLLRTMQLGTHPNFKYVYLGMKGGKDDSKKQTNISVEHIRESKKFLQRTSTQEGKKILLIDDAHAMGEGAANALLKVLEEPVSGAVIFLITPSMHKLLPTIRSRCRCIRASTLQTQEIYTVLKAKFPHMEEEKRHAYAKMAKGSVGTAITYATHDTLSLYGLMIEALSKDWQAVYTLINAVTGKNAEKKFPLLEQIASNWLDDMLLDTLKNEHRSAILAQENVAIETILKKYTRNVLIDWIEFVKRCFKDAYAPTYLDKKTLLLTIFLPLHGKKEHVKRQLQKETV